MWQIGFDTQFSAQGCLNRSSCTVPTRADREGRGSDVWVWQQDFTDTLKVSLAQQGLQVTRPNSCRINSVGSAVAICGSPVPSAINYVTQAHSRGHTPLTPHTHSSSPCCCWRELGFFFIRSCDSQIFRKREAPALSNESFFFCLMWDDSRNPL